MSERQGRCHLTKGRCPPLDHQPFRVSPKQETKAASPWQRQEPRLFPEQMEDMVRQCRSASQWEVGGTGLEEQMFWPLWSEQQHRFYVPCTGVKEFHWERRCKCTTLGMLFRALGRAFTASCIYYYYLTRRLVVVKHSPMGSKLKQGVMLPEKRNAADSKESLKDIAAIILADMQPPWLAVNPSDTWAGLSTAWAFVKHTLLIWTADSGTSMLFGEELAQQMISQCDAKDVEFAGVVGRPLYTCTAMLDDGPCGKAAIMCPFVDFPLAATCWRCRKCRDVPHQSQEEATRLISLWPLVHCETGHTPMRTHALETIVFPPPSVWQWGAKEKEIKEAMAEHKALPDPAPIKRRGHFADIKWCFGKQDSDMIWRCAQGFASALPAAPSPGRASAQSSAGSCYSKFCTQPGQYKCRWCARSSCQFHCTGIEKSTPECHRSDDCWKIWKANPYTGLD